MARRKNTHFNKYIKKEKILDKKEQKQDLKSMQVFTRDNYFVFPVVGYDYTGDDGWAISIRDGVFNDKLTQAIDYSQSKAWEKKTTEFNLISLFIPCFFIFVMYMYAYIFSENSTFTSSSLFMLTITGFSSFFLAKRIISLHQERKVLESSFVEMVGYKKKDSTIKIANFTDLKGFNCPEDFISGARKIPNESWDRLGLGHHCSDQDMASLIIDASLSNPSLHKKALNIVREIPKAHNEEKIKKLYQLSFMITNEK